jgi:hypothetical protein
MGEKRKLYEALVDGAMDGLTDKALHEYVTQRCENASGKKIVQAAILALQDPHLKDRNILDTICTLAIKHRADDLEPKGSRKKRDAWPAPFARQAEDAAQAANP